MVERLKQLQYVPMQAARQVLIIGGGTRGMMDYIPTTAIGKFEKEFFAFMDKNYPEVEPTLAKEKVISEASEAKLKDAVTKFKAQFKA